MKKNFLGITTEFKPALLCPSVGSAGDAAKARQKC